MHPFLFLFPDTTCRAQIGQYVGYIETPNFPGDYPANVDCTWHIKPPRGRKVIFVVSEIFLRKEDQCGDIVVIRKTGKTLKCLRHCLYMNLGKLNKFLRYDEMI